MVSIRSSNLVQFYFVTFYCMTDTLINYHPLREICLNLIQINETFHIIQTGAYFVTIFITTNWMFYIYGKDSYFITYPNLFIFKLKINTTGKLVLVTKFVNVIQKMTKFV